MEKAKVYFTKRITPESLVSMYEILGRELKGRIAIKISTGEAGGHNFLDPHLIQDLVQKLNGTIVECNTAYNGKRMNTEEHLKVVKDHGFLDISFVDILDQEGDIALSVTGGKHLQENYVGKNIQNYDAMVMLSHFKGACNGRIWRSLKKYEYRSCFCAWKGLDT